ncbi:phage baseplate protein [Thomasclavelia ramosa]|uniref:phage baseplate protein n=1 Tax=Thomasclavelia ramosa TaxID=1547 RepID=UPI001D635035|nr:hypothetical protein [Thomasclavelia ramosa]MBS5941477.1 hypothetical protein [Ligilactobacillus salivarius]MCM1647301.1 hypothetical protein [Thomasclavelia ramosa]
MAIKKGQMTDNETGDLLYFQTSYDMVTDKPTNFPPSSHNHDDRYYTEAEINTKLTAKLDTTGNASNVTNTFTQASTLANLTTGEKLSVSLGKIMKAIADLISHIGNKSNPHGVTKSQVGLGNVDNTTDLNKPISTATQKALDGKASASHTHTSSQVGLGNVTNDAQVKRSEMGVSSGVATLDTTGKVPSSQLPSYLALGETSSTAYPGNKGKTTTDNVNAILAGTKVVPKATDANTLDGKDSTNFASAADLAKKLDKSGGTMEGVFNVDTLYFKVNTASGYRQAFETIRGGLLALGSDELSAALYGYDKNQKPQWVYKEGTSYVFKDLALKDDIYPVGAIYMSVSSTSPASLFGGTWTQWGSGRVPIGINSSDSDFNTVEKTGGNKEFELRALIGAVGGNVNTIGYDSEAVVPGYGSYDMVLDASAGAKPQGASNTTRVVKSDGSSPTTVQPYITCYYWKRVS